MKKLFPLLLALALLLSGCGRREETPPDPAQNPPAETEEPAAVKPATTFWERIAQMFQDFWSTLTGVFH